MFLEYLIIISCGCGSLMLLDKVIVIKKIRKYFYKNKIYFWCSLLLFCMLFIPQGDINRFEDGNDFGVSRIFRLIGFIFLFFYFLFYIIKNEIFPKQSILYYFLSYIVVCFFSALYAPNLLETVWKSFELLVLIQLVLIFKNELRNQKLLVESVFSGIIYFLLISIVFSILGYILFPEIAFRLENEFEVELANKSIWGIIPNINPNSLGQFSAMLSFVGIYFLLYIRRSKKAAFIFLTIGVIGQILAYSRTSMFAFVLISLFLVLKEKKLKYKLLSLFSIPLLLFLENQLLNFVSRGQTFNQLSSLSGRTYMWGIAWESVKNNPYFGLGFYSGHKSLDIQLGMVYSSLDNTYLEALVNVGLIGTFFLVIFVSKAVYRNYKLLKYQVNIKEINWIWISFGFLIIMLIRSFSGPSFQVFHVNLYFLLLIVITQEYLLNVSRN